MSRIRTGLGPDDWRDEGDAHARVSGFGGRMPGSYLAPVFTPQPRPNKFATPEARAADNARRSARRRAAK